jgi:DNA-binding transcriptional ArsR family regulator
MRQIEHPHLEALSLEGALSALGDPVRLSVVQVLADGEEHVQSDFDVPVSASTLSHHMKTLREAGLVHSRPEGTRCYVSLRPDFEQRFPELLKAVLRLTRER